MATEYIEKFALPTKAGLKRDLLLTSVHMTASYIHVNLKIVTYETVNAVDTEIDDFTFEVQFNSIHSYYNTSTGTILSEKDVDTKNLPANIVKLMDYVTSLNSFTNFVTLVKNILTKAKDADLLKLTKN